MLNIGKSPTIGLGLEAWTASSYERILCQEAIPLLLDYKIDDAAGDVDFFYDFDVG